MTEPTLHTPPTVQDINPSYFGPAYNAVRIRNLLTDKCGTIDLQRTTADGGAQVVGRARYSADARFDVMLLHPTASRIVGYAKQIDGLTWSVWRADGAWVGYSSTLAYGVDVINNGTGADTNRMHRGAMSFETRET